MRKRWGKGGWGRPRGKEAGQGGIPAGTGEGDGEEEGEKGGEGTDASDEVETQLRRERRQRGIGDREGVSFGQQRALRNAEERAETERGWAVGTGWVPKELGDTSWHTPWSYSQAVLCIAPLSQERWGQGGRGEAQCAFLRDPGEAGAPPPPTRLLGVSWFTSLPTPGNFR